MKKLTLLTLAISLILVFSLTCKRGDISPPEPFAPSSLTTLLKLTASPNAIFASKNTRGMTTITARLTKYNGEPLPNRVIYFEVVDSNFQKISLGYFEGNQSVVAKTTDSNGLARINYYGPLTLELSENTTIYVRATVAWEGAETIFEVAPIIIITEPSDLTFTAEAEPDVLYATDERPQTTIKGIVKIGGKPIAGIRIYFHLYRDSPGRFDDGYRATYRETDETGTARITYIGPNKYEIEADTSIIVIVQLTESIYTEVYLRVIRQR
ncbi:MAG: hypothetical protein N3B16_13065 [Candidatus Aminicenantes bacterium]|nr:hypothetical protein [Candidatus Aminicenantes bacterium]